MDEAADRLLREKDEDLCRRMRAHYDVWKTELADAKREFATLSEAKQPSRSAEEEVELALELFDDIQRVASDSNARSEI